MLSAKAFNEVSGQCATLRFIRIRLTGWVFKEKKGGICMKGELSSKEAGSPFQSAVFLLCPGFEGSICGHNVDDCPNHNCQNGGICVDGVNTYNCRCPPQWTGMYYRKQMQDFWPSPNVQLELHMAECSLHLRLVLQSGEQMSVQPLKENSLHQSHHNGG